MSGKRGSNPRPSAWEADALPTELLPHWSFFVMPKVMIIFPLCNEKMLKKFFGLCSGFVAFVLASICKIYFLSCNPIIWVNSLFILTVLVRP